MWYVFALGFLTGLGAVTAPGPINLEVIRRSVSRGPKVGAAFGVGALSVDFFYLVAISLGAAALFPSLPQSAGGIIRLVGAALFLVLGINILRAKPARDFSCDGLAAVEAVNDQTAVAGANDSSAFKSYLWGMALALSNPVTIAYWMGVCVTAREAAPHQAITPPLVAGVGVAFSLWLLGIVALAGRFRQRIPSETFQLVERCIGTILCFLAVYVAYLGIRLIIQ